MGCNNGKMVQVGTGATTLTVAQKSMPLKPLSCEATEEELLDGTTRFGSASSKGSHRSGDSGCFEDEVDEYAGIITEDSETADIIERDFIPNECIDLCLSGIPAPRNLSAKDKARLDEQRILEDLRNEGLITTSKFQAKSGMAFDVVAAQPDQSMSRRAPPARLAKLDVSKAKSKELTKEQIEEKLARAEQRKKAKEQARLRKIHRAVSHHHELQENQQEEQVQHQKELREQTIEKVDTAATNREKQLQQKIAKQKAREERAAKVRLRKKLHIPTQEELDEIEASQLAEQQLLDKANTNLQPRNEDSIMTKSGSSLPKQPIHDIDDCLSQPSVVMEPKTAEEIVVNSTVEEKLELLGERADNNEVLSGNLDHVQPVSAIVSAPVDQSPQPEIPSRNHTDDFPEIDKIENTGVHVDDGCNAETPDKSFEY